MTATVLRCVPIANVKGNTISFPDPAALEAAAARICADLWAIWVHTRRAYQNGTIFQPYPTREVFFDAAVSVATQGGCAGWQVPLRVALPGYREAP
jgi:hypothetical protein